MVEDKEGFLYPAIDENKCVHCGRCRNVCPILSKMPAGFQRQVLPKTYACWINNDSIRLQSSSGGLFSAIAMSALDDGGVVFGAAFDENMHLHHIGVVDTASLEKLRRSKYIQSEIGDSYKLTKNFLDQGKLVFFMGTPCQIAGLNHYLGKDYDNLITADLICHGVPSPGVFSKYVKYLENIYGCRLTNINFRDKRKGWSNGFFVKANLNNGKEVMLTGKRNCFLYGFGQNYFLRKSCYNCAFRRMPRQADFTLADFWGIQDKYPDEAYKGISCLLVNSSKGKKCFDLLNTKVSFFEEPFSKAKEANKNLYRSTAIPTVRELFFEDFAQKPFTSLIEKYLTPSLINRLGIFLKCRLDHRTITLIKKCKNFWRRW